MNILRAHRSDREEGKAFLRVGARALVLWLACGVGMAGSPALHAQSSTGELRLHISDSQGLALPSQVTIVSEANRVHESLLPDEHGDLIVPRLPFGEYVVTVEHAGFGPVTQMADIHSALPEKLTITLRPATAQSSVVVSGSQTLLDPELAGAVNRIGKRQIEDRQISLPGRGLVDLVNEEPGWLYEGNAVLHPRGSEYQTQFVLNGIPLTDNRSPGFGSQIETSDVQSVAIYTAGIPAEYGRKMGGVIEVNTLRDLRRGLHGTAMLAGGSFATANGYGAADYGWGKNSAGVSASGAYTDWFENPPVLQNYTNNATTGSFSGDYERQFSSQDRLTATVRHEFARLQVPNEQLQEAAGQSQHRSTLETMGTAAWQHIFSTAVLTDVRGMVRDDTVLLSSNAASTPIIAGQDRGFREGYGKATITLEHGRQEFKAGVEGDFMNLHEGFNYQITDPSQFDPGTPRAFDFFERGRDREQAVFIEDNAHLGAWTIAPGLRWDNYELVVDQNALSPRLAISRYFRKAALMAHVSYDRVFQTPAFENLLLSSSPKVISLDPQVLREPVRPSLGNYFEAGVTKGLLEKIRVDANYYVRRFSNFADDNPLLDTSISFPIAFRRASIYGAEAKISVPRWGIVSGNASYSYMVGSAFLPVTGGLFLGDSATQALAQTSGRLWVSQDQRNTVRTRWVVHLPRGLWAASGMEYGSGLPVDFDGTREQALAQYGAQLVNRVNFSRGRVDPMLAFDASMGAEWHRKNHTTMRLQADGENLNNRINLIDFAGMFSGNAVAPPRSWGLTLTMEF